MTIETNVTDYWKWNVAKELSKGMHYHDNNEFGIVRLD